MTKLWIPFRLALLATFLTAGMRTNADDRLALELNVTCHRARLKQQLLVADNDGFYVATKADGVKWTISGQISAVAKDAVRVSFRVEAAGEHGARLNLAEESRSLELDKFIAPRAYHHRLLSIGVWIHRGMDASPALGRAIAQRDEDLLAAVRELAECGGETGAVLREMLKLLADHSLDDGCEAGESIRVVAAEAIGRLNRDATSAAPGLIQAMKDANPYVQHAAAVALGGIDRDESVARKLGELLAHQDAHVRYLAARAVEQIAAESSDCVNTIPKLNELMADDDQYVRLAAARALLALGEENAPAACLTELSENSSNRRLRRLAKHALQRQAAGYRPDPLPASAVN